MENPGCIATPPDSVQIMLWTVVAVFGVVYTVLGYRCLRAVGFLSGLAAGVGCILWLQSQHITVLGNQAAPALAIVTGLCGAILGSTHPIASALLGAFSGALVAAASMVLCIANIPDQQFGEQEVLVAVGGGAIIFAVMTLCSGKVVTIIASSIVGAAMITCSTDFFMHGLKTIDWVSNIRHCLSTA